MLENIKAGKITEAQLRTATQESLAADYKVGRECADEARKAVQLELSVQKEMLDDIKSRKITEDQLRAATEESLASDYKADRETVNRVRKAVLELSANVGNSNSDK